MKIVITHLSKALMRKIQVQEIYTSGKGTALRVLINILFSLSERKIWKMILYTQIRSKETLVTARHKVVAKKRSRRMFRL